MLKKNFWRFWAPIMIIGALATVAAFTGRAQNSPNYDRIAPNLYLGGYVQKPPPGTKAVLNLCETEDLYKAPSHRWVPIVDVEPAPGLDWIKTQVEFIDAERKADHQTYVHCRNGVNRSAFVVVAYLMYSEKMTRDEALKFVQAKRSVRPNPIFMERLLEWEKEIKK